MQEKLENIDFYNMSNLVQFSKFKNPSNFLPPFENSTTRIAMISSPIVFIKNMNQENSLLFRSKFRWHFCKDISHETRCHQSSSRIPVEKEQMIMKFFNNFDRNLGRKNSRGIVTDTDIAEKQFSFVNQAKMQSEHKKLTFYRCKMSLGQPTLLQANKKLC